MERFDLGMIRESLRKLAWGGGLSRDAVRDQWHNMPEQIYNALPKDYVFRDDGEVMSYLEHLLRHGAIENLRDTGEDPQQYKPSLGEVTHQPREHGVGSGADPGYSGGGSVQTGVDRGGTTYGDTEELIK